MSEAVFAQMFGHAAECSADAPGRVNLMGEHTDYNGGSVLPVAIPQRTRVWLAARKDNRVRPVSATFGGGVVEYRLGEEAAGRGFIDYVQGVTRAVANDGYAIRGFDLYIDSTVPVGAGLSSSAALEVSLLRGLRALFRLAMDDVALARLGQRAEVELVGARVGIMDQMAASLADEQHALLLNTLDLSFRRVPLPASLEIAIIDSGIRHSHAAGDYNQRRRECEEAAALLRVTHLCQLDLADLPAIEALPELLRRRARHVIRENARVSATAEALATGDATALGHLFGESHASQRDDFQVSIPAVDRLIEAAVADPDVVAARLTGGGFGGSIVLLTRAGVAGAATSRVVERSGVATARGVG